MIEIVDLSFAYPGQPDLFHHFSWSVERGCSWSVVGASGVGKTTLLYLLAGLVQPHEGNVEIDGVQIVRPRPQTGLILQNLGLMPWSTAEGNVSLGLRVRRFYGPDGKHAPIGERLGRDEVRKRTEKWLRRMLIEEHRRKYPSQLSGGQQQRVAIARTLVLEPSVLLMDEPFASLDSPTRGSFQDLLLELERETGHTRVLVTHDVEEATFLGRKILVLGRTGVPAEILDNPGVGLPAYRGALEFAETCDRIDALVGRK